MADKLGGGLATGVEDNPGSLLHGIIDTHRRQHRRPCSRRSTVGRGVLWSDKDSCPSQEALDPSLNPLLALALHCKEGGGLPSPVQHAYGLT